MEVKFKEKVICNDACLLHQHLYFYGLWKKTESIAGATPTPVPKSTSETADTVTPEQELSPVEEFVELSEDEIDELRNKTYKYEHYLWYSGFIVGYYKYIGLEDFEMPVLVCYQTDEAEKRFGGEWEYISGAIMETTDQGIPFEEQNWLRGKLTIAKIEQELLYGDKGRLYIANDSSIESIYADDENGLKWNPPLYPFAEYMRWLRHFGHFMVTEDTNGNPSNIGCIHYFSA